MNSAAVAIVKCRAMSQPHTGISPMKNWLTSGIRPMNASRPYQTVSPRA